ncbi:MAG: SCO family protein, partial [Fimbriiglobus sp.]
MSGSSPSPAPRIVRIAAPLLLAVGVATLVAAFVLPTPQRTVPTNLPADAPLAEVPAFSLTERSGKTVTAADLRGKVWVASFVFTRCT